MEIPNEVNESIRLLDYMITSETNHQSILTDYRGLWLAEPKALRIAMESCQDMIDVKAQAKEEELFIVEGGVAVIQISGVMTKGFNFFGTSTLQVRKMLAQAAADKDVRAILLRIDSPGGTVSGTKELADEVAKVAKKKLVVAQIEDLGASAAFWVASQANFVFANDTAEIGSIGTFAVAADFSKMLEDDGIKVHVITNTEGEDFKGAFAFGSEITDKQIADVKSIINELHQFFRDAVVNGRGFSESQMAKVGDGRTFVAKKAKSLGLIDGVRSIETTIGKILLNFKNEDAKKRGRRTQIELDMAEMDD